MFDHSRSGLTKPQLLEARPHDKYGMVINHIWSSGLVPKKVRFS